jgi:hypothetical protein
LDGTGGAVIAALALTDSHLSGFVGSLDRPAFGAALDGVDVHVSLVAGIPHDVDAKLLLLVLRFNKRLVEFNDGVHVLSLS